MVISIIIIGVSFLVISGAIATLKQEEQLHQLKFELIEIEKGEGEI